VRDVCDGEALRPEELEDRNRTDDEQKHFRRRNSWNLKTSVRYASLERLLLQASPEKENGDVKWQ